MARDERVPLRGRRETRQHRHRRRFSRTVGTEKTRHLSLVQRQVERTHRARGRARAVPPRAPSPLGVVRLGYAANDDSRATTLRGFHRRAVRRRRVLHRRRLRRHRRRADRVRVRVVELVHQHRAAFTRASVGEARVGAARAARPRRSPVRGVERKPPRKGRAVRGREDVSEVPRRHRVQNSADARQSHDFAEGERIVVEGVPRHPARRALSRGDEIRGERERGGGEKTRPPFRA